MLPLPGGAKALHRALRPLVQLVCLQPHAVRAEIVEEMAELEILRLGVRDGTPSVATKERPADLGRLVRAVDVQEARAPDRRAVLRASREERHLVAEDLFLEGTGDPALELGYLARYRHEHQAPDVVVVRHGEELGGVLAPQRLEANVRSAERHGPRVELGSPPPDDVGHLHVIDEAALVGHDAVALDPLDLESSGLVRGDRAVVEGEHAEGDAVDTQVVDQVLHEQPESLAAKALSPERRLADTDADLCAPSLRLKVAVVRLTDRASLVLDREHDSAVLRDHVDPPATRRVIGEAARAAAPLVPGEVRVIGPTDQMWRVSVRHRPERHALATQCRRGRGCGRHAIASPAVGACAAKSAGRALVSRSFLIRSRNASKATPRSSSREPRRRTDTAPTAASLSPTTSM
jgi:hypothetical protein